MELTIARDPFHTAVAAAQHMAAVRIQPILSHILCEATDGQLTLSATNLSLGIRYPLPAEVAAPGAIALPAKKLAENVSTLPDALIRLKADGEGTAVALTCERATFQLRGLPAAEFPRLPTPGATSIHLPSEALSQLVDRTVFAASKDETRSALMGVQVELNGQGLRLMATDGHRLAIAQAPLEHGAETLDALVPSEALRTVRKLTAGRSGPLTVLVGEDASQLLFIRDDLQIHARLVDGQFPNVDGVIPQGGSTVLQVARTALRDALRRIAPIAGPVGPTTFALAPQTLRLSSQQAGVGEAHEELDATSSGAPLTAGFNARYLLEFLEACEAERVSFTFTDPLSPCLCRADADEEYSYIVMPMRI